MMIEEPDFDRMEAISLVDEKDRTISSTQMHPCRRYEEYFYYRFDLMNCFYVMSWQLFRSRKMMTLMV